MGPFCVHGVPLLQRCRRCDHEEDRAAAVFEDPPGDGDEWQVGQARYERWLDRIGGSR